MHSDDQKNNRQGMFLALFTYTIWGLFPLYFHLLSTVSALEILMHRIFWTSALTFSFIAFSKKRRLVWTIISNLKNISPYLLSAFLLAINWGLYIYGVVKGDFLQLSLAYFINPLFNVLFGVLFFKEHLGKLTKIAIALALTGILYRVFGANGLPILAISIAIAFSLYGVMRKRTKADSISALFIESTLVLPFITAAFIIYTPMHTLQLMQQSHYWLFMLVLAGPITSIPLITFSMAVKRIPYYLIGFYQYLAPTLVFLSAIFLFKQAWTIADLITFGLVWAGIILVIIEKLTTRKQPSLIALVDTSKNNADIPYKTY